ncbi:3890_t:CDS:2 [Funneliformis mosseae]|uniref:3890_t:CDS:1 n=1 Tax=Funneliformis mosseae TaxID=27381 RepID=A0A9N9EAI1_FUNMO|nr:3890_t:CDS:2 [Funneliformis mosseae]
MDYFRRNVLPSRLVTRQVKFLQPQKLALRNSNPVLFQSSKSYTNSTFNFLLNTPFDESTSSSNLNRYLGKIGKGFVIRLPTAIYAKLVVAGIVSLESVETHAMNVFSITQWKRIASREVEQDKDNGIQGGMGVIYVDVPSDFEDLYLKKIFLSQNIETKNLGYN